MLSSPVKRHAKPAELQRRWVSKFGPHYALRKEKITAKRIKKGKHKNWSTRSQRALTHQEDRVRTTHYSWSGTKKKRTSNPNIRTKVFWSDILDRYIEIPCSMRALFKIDEMDFSIDRYILETPPVTMVSKLGEALRAEMQRALAIKEQEHWEDALTGDPEAVYAAMKTIKREEKEEWDAHLKREFQVNKCHDNVRPESFAQRWVRKELEERVAKIMEERGWEPEYRVKQPEKIPFPPPQVMDGTHKVPDDWIPPDWDYQKNRMKAEYLNEAYDNHIEVEKDWVWRQKKFKRNWITYPPPIGFHSHKGF